MRVRRHGNDHCSNVTCANVACPSDSRPAVTGASLTDDEDRCCGQRCECDYQKCENNTPTCPEGLNRYRSADSSHVPGACCDIYECREPEQRCRNVKCLDAADTFDADTTEDGGFCPPDSYRTISYVPDGSCCPSTVQCRCRAGVCAPAIECARGELLLIERRGEGRPGNCCDVFRCVVARHSSDAEQNSDKDSDDGGLRDAFAHLRKTDGRQDNHIVFQDDRPRVYMNPTQRCVDDASGRIFLEGERWHGHPCQSCTCSGGVALCRDMLCPKIPVDCGWVGLPADECCPICLGCADDAGDHWHANQTTKLDDCTTCSCSADLKWHCQKFICKQECENPQKVEEECCPQCDEPLIVAPPVMCASLELCTLRCVHGLARNQWGCYECRCRNDDTAAAVPPSGYNPEESREPARHADYLDVNDPEGGGGAIDSHWRAECIESEKSICNKYCAHGRLRDIYGCELCKCIGCAPVDDCLKQCLYGFETNATGCPICKCRVRSQFHNLPQQNRDNNDSQNTTDQSIDKINASYSNYSIEGANLPHSIDQADSSGCFSGSTIRDSGEWWTDGQCRQCYCNDGIEYCSIISCPHRPDDCPDDRWVRDPAECCPKCTTPTPRNGNATIIERSTGGARTVCYSPGDGRLRVDGETWPLAASTCIRCTCRMGHVMCASTTCPPLLCNRLLTVEDGCCQRCLDPITTVVIGETPSDLACVDADGTAHPAGTVWRADECTSCACATDGESRCYAQHCDAPLGNCRHLLSIKGRCCPVCSDILQPNSSAICRHGGRSYAVGERFRESSAGRECVCGLNGAFLCVDSVYAGNEANLASLEIGRTETIFFDRRPVLGVSTPHATDGTTALLIASAIAFSLLFVFIALIWLVALWKCSKKNYKKKKTKQRKQQLEQQQQRNAERFQLWSSTTSARLITVASVPDTVRLDVGEDEAT